MGSGRRREDELIAAWPAATIVAMPGADHILYDRGGDAAALTPTWLPVVVA